MNLNEAVSKRRVAVESSIQGTIIKMVYRPNYSPADEKKKLRGSMILTMIRKGWDGTHTYDVFLSDKEGKPALEVVNMEDYDLWTDYKTPVDRHFFSIAEQIEEGIALLSRRINR